MTPATSAQRELLEYLDAHARQHRAFPSMREAAEDLGVSYGAVRDRLMGLIRKGYVQRPLGFDRISTASRAYRITRFTAEAGWRCPEPSCNAHNFGTRCGNPTCPTRAHG